MPECRPDIVIIDMDLAWSHRGRRRGLVQRHRPACWRATFSIWRIHTTQSGNPCSGWWPPRRRKSLQGALSLFRVRLPVVRCGLASLAARHAHVAGVKVATISLTATLVVPGLT